MPAAHTCSSVAINKLTRTHAHPGLSTPPQVRESTADFLQKLTGMQDMRWLEIDDENEPGVVQEVSRGVALGQDAECDAWEQGPGGKPRDRKQHLRFCVCDARAFRSGNT